MLAMTAWTALGSVLIFLISGHTSRQVQVFWVFQPPLDVVLALSSWRVYRIATGAVRRFWRILAAVGSVFLIGDCFQTTQVLFHPQGMSTTGGPVQVACLILGQLALVISMLTQPHATRSGRERLALWLDSAAVLVGGAVVSWCFAAAPTGNRQAAILATVAASGVALTTGFAFVKMVLSGNAPMNKLAATPMIAAAAVVGWGIFLAPGSGTAAVPAVTYAILLLPSLLISTGPRVQELLARTDAAPFGARRKKPYSLLPYGAIVIGFGALLAIMPQGTTVQLWGVVTGVILITGLVAGRQLVAFHDNANLIGRLDNTLGDLREHQGLLRDQALFDGLTKLANRSNFGERVAQALAGDISAGVSLLLIDLDDFKTINDTMGHAAGDELLVVIAGRLGGAVRAADCVARLGGDEFAVLLTDAGPREAELTARRILDDLARPTRIQQNTLLVRASIGVAGAGPGDDPQSLLRDADIAMYSAKDNGKGSWVRYTPDMGERILHVVELTRRLGEALDKDQFYLDYQPIVLIGNGTLTGTEALVRWRPYPDRPSVLPAEFIPVCEESGLIVPLGRWVLREACRQAGVWRQAYPAAADQVIAVNVAGRQLREAGFVAEVAAALATAGLPAGCLSIEVTETAVLDDDVATATLHALRDLGVQLALDDFGTAASSLGLLLTCPVTTLKLDRSFVEDVTTVDRQQAVATAVSQMANALGLKSVAEGIETREQARLLQDLGYQYAQGFLFSHPVPPDQVAAMWALASRQSSSARVWAG
jgi:diguanylate cyclase (GGDEF)-like protein